MENFIEPLVEGPVRKRRNNWKAKNAARLKSGGILDLNKGNRGAYWFGQGDDNSKGDGSAVSGGNTVLGSDAGGASQGLAETITTDNVVHSYGCLMADVPETISDLVSTWQSENLVDSDLYEDEGGLETNSHITVKYGFTSNDSDKILATIPDIGPIPCTLGEISLFNAPTHDVIIIKVKSKMLETLHRMVDKEGIKNDLCIEDKFPEYLPHMTIAYVKKGAGDHFKGSRDFKDKSFEISRIVLSDPEKNESYLDL